MRGLVIKNAGFTFWVKTDQGDTVEDCRVKGNFRIKGIRTTSPVAIGDRVQLEMQPDGSAWITAVEERTNYIIRRASNLSKESQIMAANIDVAVLVATISHPQTLVAFIDRFLITAEAYHIPACIVFNKTDLYDEHDNQTLAEHEQLYGQLGYATYRIQALKPSTVAEFAQTLADKTVLLAGNSGVGKSTLINALTGTDVTKTGDISVAHDKGMHTTTFSEMYTLPNGGRIIDSPGIRGFGIVDMQAEEIGHYFKEIHAIAADCRFSDCKHLNEPGCAVRAAVANGQIAPSRFESYLSMLDDCTQSKYR